MRAKLVLVISAVLVGTLSGCLGDNAPTPGGGKGAAGSDVTASTASSVTVVSLPAEVLPNTDALVCWRIEGSGKVDHVAVHYDSVSHPASTAKFTDYAGGTIYPANFSSPSPAGYVLPGTFCTAIPVDMNDVYFRAHVIDSQGGDGKVSEERKVAVKEAPTDTSGDTDTSGGSATGAAATSVTLTNYPSTAVRGTKALVCWRVGGSGSVDHVAVHYDYASHADAEATFVDYAAGVSYPNNKSSPDAAGYDLPGDFCTSVTMGTKDLYLRAHVIDSAGGIGVLSSEIIIIAKAPPPTTQLCAETLTSRNDDYDCTLNVEGPSRVDISVTLSDHQWSWTLFLASGIICSRANGDGSATLSCTVPAGSKGEVKVRVVTYELDSPATVNFVVNITNAPRVDSDGAVALPTEVTCRETLRTINEDYDCTYYAVGPGTLSATITLGDNQWSWTTFLATGITCSRRDGDGSGSILCDVPEDVKGQITVRITTYELDAPKTNPFTVTLDYEPTAAGTSRAALPTSQTCSESLDTIHEDYDCSLYSVGPGTLAIAVTLSSNKWSWTVFRPSGVDCTRTGGDGSGSLSCTYDDGEKGELKLRITTYELSAPSTVTFTVTMNFTAS